MKQIITSMFFLTYNLLFGVFIPVTRRVKALFIPVTRRVKDTLVA